MELHEAAAAETAREELPVTEESWLEARCPECGTGLKWKVGATADELERDGFTRGWHDDGLPNCPRCGTKTAWIERKPAHEAITEAAAALTGTQTPLPFPAPPFDLSQALKLIAERNRDVQHARGEFEDLKAQTSEARKHLDHESELLEKLIADLDARRRDAEAAASRPRLPLDDACPYERETGRACPICRESMCSRASITDEVLQTVLARTAEGVHVSIDEIQSWSPDDRRQVEDWTASVAHGDHPDWPAALETSHIAGEPGEGGRQGCVICGAQIGDTNDVAYARSARVGLDCPGAPAAKPAA